MNAQRTAYPESYIYVSRQLRNYESYHRVSRFLIRRTHVEIKGMVHLGPNEDDPELGGGGRLSL